MQVFLLKGNEVTDQKQQKWAIHYILPYHSGFGTFYNPLADKLFVATLWD